MNQNTKNPLWLSLVLIVVGLLALSGVWLYLAGAFFMQFSGMNFEDAEFLTFYQYWYHYGKDEQVLKDLYLAGGLSFAGLFIPIVLIALPRKKTLHGDRRFAKNMEIKAAGLHKENGVIVGQSGKRILMYAGDKHIGLAAPTRSGKGVSVVIPNCLNYGQSLVVADTKQEAFDITSRYRENYGQDVFLLNFSPRDYRSHRWNPLSYISEDPNFRVNDIQKIAYYIFPDIDNQDPIWSSSGRSLFLGTVLYLFETPGKPVTFGEVLRTVTQSEEAGAFYKRIIQERYEAGNPLSAVCMSALNDFIATSENTRNSIRKTFSSRFEMLYNPLIDSVLSDNDFDLRQLRRKKMTIYVGVAPGDLERLQPLMNLFFQQLVDLNLDELPEKNPDLKYECLLLLDEFTALGAISSIKNGISYLAGYGLKVFLIFQGHSQVRDVYGHDAAETFSTNMGIQTEFAPAPQDFKRAEEISKILGNQTWKVKSKGKSFGSRGNRSENQSEQSRPLMLPQEVAEIGMWKQFIFVENCLPIFCDKLRYFVEPVFMDRLKEMSPLLAKCGKELPTKSQMDSAVAAGELRAAVPTITVSIPEIPIMKFEPAEQVETTAQKALTASDVDKIDSLRIEDFSCDFTDVEIPKDPISDEQMQEVANAMLEKFGF